MKDTIVKLLQPTQPVKGKVELRTAQASLGKCNFLIWLQHTHMQQAIKDHKALWSDTKVLITCHVRTESKLDDLVAGASKGYQSATSQIGGVIARN